jgi:transposase InsO family protein
MTSLTQRQIIITLVDQACLDGARYRAACAVVGQSARTLQRWRTPANTQGDRRRSGLRTSTVPANALSQAERETLMETINSDEFKDLPPSQIVPRLADQQIYLASESTMYRLLRSANQMTHRRAERPAQQRSKPRALQATAVNQIYTWDITYLPTQIKGLFYYLYLFVDIFSRQIVGWQVFERESAEHASALMHDICLQNGISPNQLTLHSDNGSPMKGETMLATLQRLGVAHTRSRPAVSNDNPYSESLFKTLKYRPTQPLKPFADLLQARRWVTKLVHWYNEQHRHSAIGFVTPAERHAGKDRELLKNRTKIYELARQTNPGRWSGKTRNWEHIDVVHLNPDAPEIKEAVIIQKAA